MASIGAALSIAARGAGNAVGISIPSSPRINENGLPVHERTPRTSGRSISVAQGTLGKPEEAEAWRAAQRN